MVLYDDRAEVIGLELNWFPDCANWRAFFWFVERQRSHGRSFDSSGRMTVRYLSAPLGVFINWLIMQRGFLSWANISAFLLSSGRVSLFVSSKSTKALELDKAYSIWVDRFLPTVTTRQGQRDRERVGEGEDNGAAARSVDRSISRYYKIVNKRLSISSKVYKKRL